MSSFADSPWAYILVATSIALVALVAVLLGIRLVRGKDAFRYTAKDAQRWKLIHQRGIVRYIFRNSIIPCVCGWVVGTAFSSKSMPPSLNITFLLIFTCMVALQSCVHFHRGERQYAEWSRDHAG